MISEIPVMYFYSRCRNRARSGLTFGQCWNEFYCSVPSNKVRVYSYFY